MNTEQISEKRLEDAREDYAYFLDELDGRRFWNSLDDDEKEAMREYARDLEMRGWES